jgi:hypothetical protein
VKKAEKGTPEKTADYRRKSVSALAGRPS